MTYSLEAQKSAWLKAGEEICSKALTRQRLEAAPQPKFSELFPEYGCIRFSPALQRSMVMANAEAEDLKHPEIGTLHLLLGLLHNRSFVKFIHSKPPVYYGITYERIRFDIECAAQYEAASEDKPRSKIGLSEVAQEAVVLAVKSTTEEGRGKVDSLDMLIGILETGLDSPAAQLLWSHGFKDAKRLRPTA